MWLFELLYLLVIRAPLVALAWLLVVLATVLISGGDD